MVTIRIRIGSLVWTIRTTAKARESARALLAQGRGKDAARLWTAAVFARAGRIPVMD